MHWERWILELVAKIPPTTRCVFLFWGGGCPLNMEKRHTPVAGNRESKVKND